MKLETLSPDALRRGIVSRDGSHQCVLCGKSFADGEVYALEGRYFEAARAARLHLEREHPGYPRSLIDSDSKYNTLTDNQKQLLHLFSQGIPDKEIAARLGVTPSTVRHQKFQFREKAKQAKLYLAIYESALEGEPPRDAMMPIHDNARMVDQRYVVTLEEQEQILAGAFASLDPPRLIRFPPKQKKKVVILTRIAGEFEENRTYTEREVNDILRPIFEDYVTLRRYLIEYGFMTRNPDGSAYRLA